MKLILTLGKKKLGEIEIYIPVINNDYKAIMQLDETVLREYIEDIARWTPPGRLK